MRFLSKIKNTFAPSVEVKRNREQAERIAPHESLKETLQYLRSPNFSLSSEEEMFIRALETNLENIELHLKNPENGPNSEQIRGKMIGDFHLLFAEFAKRRHTTELENQVIRTLTLYYQFISGSREFP